MLEISAIKWLNEAGVDEIAEETPKNFFELKDTLDIKPKKSAYTNAHEPRQVQKTSVAASLGFSEPQNADFASLTDVIAKAKQLAASAETIEDLRKAVEGFDGCGLKKTATKTVFADGNPNSGVMLIGEAPGADEDREGIPFCGMSGQLLSKVLRSIGLDRENGYYITNTIFWRPPGNRKPTPEELAICQPFLQKHVALVKPKILVLVGATAVQAILENNSSMSKLRGQTFDYSNEYMENEVKVMVTYHPSYLMRAPLNKRLAWEDMLALDEEIRKFA